MSNETAPAGSGRLLGIKDVEHEVSLDRATIYRKRKAGKFPHGKLIHGTRRVWTEREVEEWKAKVLAEAPD